MSGNVDLFGIKYQKYICKKITDFERDKRKNHTIKAAITAINNGLKGIILDKNKCKSPIKWYLPRDKIVNHDE